MRGRVVSLSGKQASGGLYHGKIVWNYMQFRDLGGQRRADWINRLIVIKGRWWKD